SAFRFSVLSAQADPLGMGFLRMASVPRVKDGMKAARFSSVELRVQAIASRAAHSQLLRVPWGRFRRAYDEYHRWQALALWGEAVVGKGTHGHSSLLATL